MRLLLVAALGMLSLPASAGERPNVLLILADDLGYGDLGCYGSPDVRSPHIDALAMRGLRFENFYANCPVCSPTRAALMTGRYPDRAGVPGVIRTHAENSWGYLDPTATTLADRFRAIGYETAIVGKWHLGLESPNTPNERGFDRFAGFLGDMMDDYVDHRRHGANYMRRDGEVIDPEGHATDLFTTWASDFLRERDRAKPFFLYVAYNAPHVPIQPPEAWLKKVRKRHPDLSEQRAKLVALIEHLDDGVGRLMKTLDEENLTENTLVMFTSDNGGDLGPQASNGALRDGKGTMYEGGLKVPAIAVWPGHIEPQSTTASPAMTMDLYPTLLEAAGASVDDPQVDGRSVLPILLGKPQPKLREEWYFVRREGGRFGGKTIETLRKGDWKLVWNDPFGPVELYDLSNDPLEERNLIDERPKIAAGLRASLMRHIQRGGATAWQRP
ncbi:MAG: sulfatase [Planctomycetaceae bacterium]